MGDWIQLTDEDIARASSVQPVEAPVVSVVTITMEDIPDEVEPVEISNTIIKITREDIRPISGPVAATAPIERLEQLMVSLVNDSRQNHMARLIGTATLIQGEQLSAIARQHSADMLRRQYVDHVTPEGMTTAHRIQRHNIGYVACGENIGVVYGESAQSEQAIYDIHEAFMNQPRSMTNHRANLLNPLWTHVGIGIARDPGGSLVATQLFISAPGQKLRGR